MKNVFVAGISAAFLAFSLAGCTAPVTKTAEKTDATCKVGAPMVQTTLYFGLSRSGGPDITSAEWQHFVDQDVTPRFRDGLTVFDARGQWLGNDGKLAKENSKALMLIHGNDPAENQKIETLRSVYKTRFAQDSVMRVDDTVCVGF
ncbi:DUF3574 domain-containing protein [Mangrovibacter plantisponsor]|uniref:Uncharacterized protein DUF3574 n=1 Tax=Mangrovibacter plantisponsor TaxID=451513 RepID=A0A317PUD7_9ENTR|nr:DUF3574 domain-containing protein [Mangrovibacter plantisponsor]PWW05866.1 uncharacterized protein DUF3574 [Mangrovibacter plantisponsor]